MGGFRTGVLAGGGRSLVCNVVHVEEREREKIRGREKGRARGE